MKKIFALILALAMALSLAACGAGAATSAAASSSAASSSASSSADAEPVELTVFAAASMTETLNQVIGMYSQVAPNVKITATYDSSGTLQKQIEQGAYCDLFISAAQKQMNALDVSAGTDTNPNGQDFVLQGSRVNILENKVVLVVPDGNPAGIESFNDLKTDKLKMIALGNSDVPVGSYSLDVLAYLGLDVKTLESAGKITYGSNVKEVTTQVSEGTVDCGIVYATDAYSAGLTVVDTATSDMCKKVLYPAAVMKDSKAPDAAQAFLDFLRTDDCSAVFQKVGFSIVK